MKTIEEEEFYLQTKFGKIHIQIDGYSEGKEHDKVYLVSTDKGSESNVMYDIQHTVFMMKPEDKTQVKGDIKNIAKELKKKLYE